MLHHDDTELFRRVEEFAHCMAEQHQLPLAVVEPKRRPNGAFGLCYHEEGRISILIRERAFAYDGGDWAPQPLPWSTIRDTVCHELAHLVYPDHGPQWANLYARIKESDG